MNSPEKPQQIYSSTISNYSYEEEEEISPTDHLNNNPTFSFEERSLIEALFKKHLGDIYSAYLEEEEFFKRVVPKLGEIGFLEKGDLGLTDERAKVIFPLFEHDPHLYLPRFPKLKGKCLENLSNRVTCITFSDKIDTKNLIYLQKLENLRVFISFDPFPENGSRLHHLFQTRLTQIEMLCPPKHINLKEILPPTLTDLTLRSGSLDDRNLSNYLGVAKLLKNLKLYFISKLTAAAFINNTTLESVSVNSCPDIDKEMFLMNSRALVKSHLTQEEASQINERFKRRFIML